MASGIVLFLLTVVLLLLCISLHSKVNSKDTLKCPCGHRAVIRIRENKYIVGGDFLYWFECTHCGRKGGEVVTYARAIASWNIMYDNKKTSNPIFKEN